MNRRAFVLAAGGAVAAGAGGTATQAAETETRAKRLRLGASYVTNSEQFRGGSQPRPGERLSLRRRADRAYDPDSIEVLTRDDQPIGFLPPASSRMLATLMDEGSSAFALVSEGTTQGRPLAVDVYLVLPA